MRLVSTKSLNENACLAKPIINDNGQVLLQQGVPLTSRMIQRLIELGITFVYIEDELTADVGAKEGISDEVRFRAIGTIKSEFNEICDDLKLKKSFHNARLNQNFAKVIRSILSEVKNNPKALSLLSDVYLYDSYIFTHSLNVTVYTLALALELKFNEKQLMEIGMGAILHDVGKMAIPTEILNKPDRLTNEEFSIIKSHAQAGYEILKDQPNISLLTAHCAFQHHERINGSGYPRGIKGDEIHLYAKIIGVCDVFDAVTSNRVYRSAMLPHEALELLYSGVGTLYDKEIVEAFRNTIAMYPVGITVGLSDGREGIVVKQNNELSTRPVVRIICEDDQKVAPYEVDLMKHVNVTITKCETVLASEKVNN
ncbi:HD-GYP domain-containing protein [Alkalihalobacillus sp. BA299]|uniref:HD-GYP domain-containing protein n=1 Tax=Alkalihalobacillus sp. BA299 TaxID=2815938 RepID=UPI001ADA09B9|nr:HD-GYP domain-containing protein [Alkalihalobacillus sp. BA299]